MSMYPWHGSTATTSTGHRTHPHPHPHQQQQQQQQHRHQHQHLPHLPHHTANAAAPAAATASNPRIDSTSTTITPTAAPPSTSAATLQMPQMPWLPSMISARANPQHATLPNLSTNLRIRPQPTPQPTALDTQQHQHQHHSQPHSLSRHSQQQQQQQQPVPMVIDARQQQQQQQQKQKQRQQKQQQAVSISSEESDFDTSDCSVRHITTADALGDQDYVSSDGMGANTIARARSHARAQQQRRHGHHPVGGGNGGTANSTTTTTPSNNQRDGPIPNGNATTTRSGTTDTTIVIDDRDDLDLDATAAGNDSADNSLNITGDREGPRKHGKRLTTLEEVSLFDICNRHAHEFGQRSNLCKWWMTVTEEFTRDQGHPYSWHSVRRKVELVTKQRMKFLDEQRERGGSESDDRSNLRWRAAVDAWIPTWQRWEEAEARRIEKRDSRRPRKRKDREWEVWVNGNNDGVRPSLGAWRATGSVSGSGSPLVNVGGAAAQLPTPSQQALSTPPASTPQHNKVRLPPGFDNMFASQPQSQYHTPTPAPATMLGGASGGRPSLDGSLALQQLNSTPSGGEAGNAESSSMMSAVLETLGKLNRHLDAANPTTTLQTSFKALKTTDSRSRAATTTTATATVQQQQQQQQPSQSQSDTSSDPDDPPSPIQAPKMSQVSSLPIPTHVIVKLKAELREEMREEMRSELAKDRASLEEKLDSVQRTQEMILEMLRQEPS